ncbi:MAG: hypothetical protein HN842_11655 [Gammaproteobacteria bacterium]|jgi:hypothetical protein|nr:hypothetical protein [Gammaproteobacteria bacterium]MBT7308863.1 hypothetical protein [Gammaproteobacteria bacterium]
MVSDWSDVVAAYLKSCRELSQMTEYNGWIDNSTLQYQIVDEDSEGVTVELSFEEIFTSACCEERAERWGRVRLGFNGVGGIESFRLL